MGICAALYGLIDGHILIGIRTDGFSAPPHEWSSNSRMVSVYLMIFLMFYTWMKVDTDGIQTGQTAPVSAAFKI